MATEAAMPQAAEAAGRAEISALPSFLKAAVHHRVRDDTPPDPSGGPAYAHMKRHGSPYADVL